MTGGDIRQVTSHVIIRSSHQVVACWVLWDNTSVAKSYRKIVPINEIGTNTRKPYSFRKKQY